MAEQVAVGICCPFGYVLHPSAAGQVVAPFSRYPQAEFSDPSRPWWRYYHGQWLRRDGVRLFSAEDLEGASYALAVRGEESLDGREVDLTEGAAAVDRLWPLEPPPLRCGQVWTNMNQEFLIGTLDVASEVTPVEFFGTLSGIHLVHGPWAPWTDTVRWEG